MSLWQQALIILYGCIHLACFVKGYFEITRKKNAFGTTAYLEWLGIFVWGDIFILGPFWILICLLTLLLNDWYLFLLFLSLFWTVRSFGEVIYWFNEQFAAKNRNLPSQLKMYKVFQNDAVWFVYQLFWQCVLIVSVIASLYLAKLWLETL